MRSPTQRPNQVCVNLSDDVLERVERERVDLLRRAPGLRASRADVLRLLICRGLTAPAPAGV